MVRATDASPKAKRPSTLLAGENSVGKFTGCALWMLLFAVAACSEFHGGETLAVTRLDGPRSHAQLLPVEGRLRSARMVNGENEVAELVFVYPEPDPVDEPIRGAIRTQSVSPPFSLSETGVRVVAFPEEPIHGYCSATESNGFDFPKLYLHRAGGVAAGPYTALVQPSGSIRLLCGQHALAAFGASRDNLGIDVVWLGKDGLFHHAVWPWPKDAEPAWGQGPLGFDFDERVLFVLGADLVTRGLFLDDGISQELGTLYWGAQTKNGELFVDVEGMLLLYDTRQKTMRRLGQRLSPEGAVLGFDERYEAALTCDWDGVRRVSLWSGQVQILDPEPCGGVGFGRTAEKAILYFSGNELRQVATDGNSPPIRITNMVDQQIFALCDDGALAYSLDPPARYGTGVGDGYIQGRRFMERGRDVRFSQDCRRVYFKEHAATLRRLGQLRRFDRDKTDSDATVRLAENVGFVSVLSDGRLLIQDNLSTVGEHNRISLIDEDKLTARTLLTGPLAVLALRQLSDAKTDGRESAVLLEVDTAEITGPRRVLRLEIPPK